ncbi:MAG: hypothetical protein AAF411_14120, partial [Myxococcota bacterium]
PGDALCVWRENAFAAARRVLWDGQLDAEEVPVYLEPELETPLGVMFRTAPAEVVMPRSGPDDALFVRVVQQGSNVEGWVTNEVLQLERDVRLASVFVSGDWPGARFDLRRGERGLMLKANLGDWAGIESELQFAAECSDFRASFPSFALPADEGYLGRVSLEGAYTIHAPSGETVRVRFSEAQSASAFALDDEHVRIRVRREGWTVDGAVDVNAIAEPVPPEPSRRGHVRGCGGCVEPRDFYRCESHVPLVAHFTDQSRPPARVGRIRAGRRFYVGRDDTAVREQVDGGPPSPPEPLVDEDGMVEIAPPFFFPAEGVRFRLPIEALSGCRIDLECPRVAELD